MEAATSSGGAANKIWRIPARIAAGASARTPSDITGGVWNESNRLLTFFGLPMPSLRRSQSIPSTRASEEWQLAQLCHPWKQSVPSLKSISPRRAEPGPGTGAEEREIVLSSPVEPGSFAAEVLPADGRSTTASESAK